MIRCVEVHNCVRLEVEAVEVIEELVLVITADEVSCAISTWVALVTYVLSL